MNLCKIKQTSRNDEMQRENTVNPDHKYELLSVLKSCNKRHLYFPRLRHRVFNCNYPGRWCV